VTKVDDVGRQAGTRRPDACAPGPPVIRNQRRAAGAIHVEFSVGNHDGRGIVDPHLAVQRRNRRGRHRDSDCKKSESHTTGFRSSFRQLGNAQFTTLSPWPLSGLSWPVRALALALISSPQCVPASWLSPPL